MGITSSNNFALYEWLLAGAPLPHWGLIVLSVVILGAILGPMMLAAKK